jgi:AraC family transcriptional regulator
VASESIGSDRLEITPQIRIDDSVIEQIGRMLLMEAEAKGSTGRLYADSLATAMAAHLIKRYSNRRQAIKDYTGGLPKYRLKRVIEYINENLEEDISLDSLAALAQMSAYHFARCFKQSTGLAPIQYIIKYRIERAKVLLKETDLSIAEIAYQLGFSNQSHFNKLFTKLTRTTPGNYRKNNKI